VQVTLAVGRASRLAGWLAGSRGTSRGWDYYTPKRQPKLLAKYVGLRNNLEEEYNPSLNVIQFQTKLTILVLTRAQCGVNTRHKIGRRRKETKGRNGGRGLRREITTATLK
jgi:hypothetical protein